MIEACKNKWCKTGGLLVYAIIPQDKQQQNSNKSGSLIIVQWRYHATSFKFKNVVVNYLYKQ